MKKAEYDNLPIDLQIRSVESAWERTICKHFSCRKELTLNERLHGNFCIHHQRGGRVDPTNWAIAETVREGYKAMTQKQVYL